MEFENEEQKKIYDKCKYIVKLWEHKFKKKHGRLPSKLDIREATSDVKDAYKTYFHLKTKTLERSFCNLDGFKFDDENENISEITKINQSESKVIDRKTDSTALHQDQPNISLVKLDLGIEESNATTSTNPTDRNDCEKFDILEQNNVHTCTKTEKSKQDNNNIIVKKTEKKQNKSYLNNVSIKFSKRNPRKAFVPSGDSGPNKNKNNNITMEDSSVSNFDAYSCAISPGIDDSHSEQDSSIHIENDLQKKTIGLQSVNIVKDLVENKTRILRKVDMQWLERISDSTQEAHKVIASQSSFNRHNSGNDNEESTDSDHIIDDSEDEESPPRKRQKILSGKPLINITRNISFSKTIQTQEAPCTQINEQDPNKNELIEPFSNLKQDMANTSQQRDRNVDVDKINEDEEPMTEKEDCCKRTLRSRNIAMNSKNSDKDVVPKTSISGKRQRAKEILEKKVKSGTLNDNFVRVNLKKKTYSRGKRSINFSKYRTRQWKKKRMEMSIEQSSDSLLPIEAYETDTLLTLEEANEKAHVKQKRTSRKADKTQENSQDESFGDWNDDCGISDETLLGIAEKGELGIAKGPDEPELSPSEPLYNDIEHTGTPPEVFEALEKFGYSSFRNGQELAVNRILEGKSTLVTLSTGSGKSLCYLLPAYLYSRRSHCITLVISPLVSLMDDQVANVPPFIKAASYHTAHTNVQKQKVKDAVAAGKITVLFVSPELLVSGERRDDLKSILNVLPPIAFACIDEAHCVSQWSHNFRPSYLLVCKILKESLKVNTLLGLTATATKATCDSIRKHFGIIDEEGVISDIPLPDNLHLMVSKVANKDEALLKLITSEKFSVYESIIVYCTRRDECEKVAGFLRTYLQSESISGNKRKRVSILAECYHAGLSASKRKAVQKAFMSGELKIVVATVAFGMGINKADIRAVVHYNLPRSVESYVQEVGRAGRDRLPAHCHVFFDMEDADKHELRRHAYSNSVDRYIIRKLLRKVFVPCQCTDTCPKHEICFSIQKTVQDLDLQEENIATVLCYLELHQNKYINILSPAYSLCKITYSSVTILKEAAKKCMPLAKALSLFHNDVKDNIFEFPVVEVASALGMSSGNCKHKLKNLEWAGDGTRSKRSPLNVQYSDLGFRLMAPGNLTKNELDDLLNNIYNQCVQNETNSLLQLEAIHSILSEAENNNHSLQSDILRSRIRSYFSSENPLESYSLPQESVDEERIIGDVRSLISNFRDVNFTGRAVARIFHGIQSPNFPAYTWGRTKFWRSHVQANFHTISRIATQEILARH